MESGWWEFTFRLTKISGNECDSGTNYLRYPRYHCILLDGRGHVGYTVVNEKITLRGIAENYVMSV